MLNDLCQSFMENDYNHSLSQVFAKNIFNQCKYKEFSDWLIFSFKFEKKWSDWLDQFDGQAPGFFVRVDFNFVFLIVLILRKNILK